MPTMIRACGNPNTFAAAATLLFAILSGFFPGTGEEVLVEVPVMLMRVKICLKTTDWFPRKVSVQ
jgi:ACR3 family arsenite transporter